MESVPPSKSAVNDETLNGGRKPLQCPLSLDASSPHVFPAASARLRAPFFSGRASGSPAPRRGAG